MAAVHIIQQTEDFTITVFVMQQVTVTFKIFKFGVDFLSKKYNRCPKCHSIEIKCRQRMYEIFTNNEIYLSV